MKKLILILSATFASGLLFVNIYTSVVDAPNWGHDIPNSLVTAKQYMSAANPGTFFRVFSPTNQILALLALVICWRSAPRIRLYCALALILAVSGDILTFTYFYPRNTILFADPQNTDIQLLKRTWSEWTFMNWPRSGILVFQIILDYIALFRVTRNAISS
jgi:hypothetical protein